MMATNPNQDICDMLMKLGEHERDVNGLLYKFVVYRKASLALASLDSRVKSGAEAKKLPGIGPKIAQKIDDFLQNGDTDPASTELPPSSSSSQKSPNNATISNDMRISSTGEDLLIIDNIDKIINMTNIDAMKFKINKITTIGELRQNTDQLTPPQIACLEHFDDLCRSISSDEIKKFEEAIEKYTDKLDDNVTFTVCGPYRRNVPECQSIDILFVDSSIKSTKNDAKRLLNDTAIKVVQALEKGGLIKQRLSLENDEFSGLVQLKKSSPYRRMNLHFVPRDQSICSLVFLTGNDKFIEQIVQHSLDNGYLLDRWSLRKIGFTCVAGQPIRLRHERDLFDYIQHPYLKPSERNL